MGFQSAANAQAQGTQQAMMLQAAAAQQQQQALQQAQQQAAGGISDYYNKGVAFQQPYLAGGEQAVNQLRGMVSGQGLAQGPTLEQLQMDPGYAFRFKQGQQAMQAQLAAGGLGGSGAALKAATRYGQEAGSQEYQNAYARFMNQRQMQLGALQNLMGTGAGAANTASGLAGNAGANLANVYSNTGSQLANVYGNLGQGLGQGAANIGSIYGQAAMGPTNLLASLAGQGLQMGGYLLGRKL